jgi:acetoacetyl-CoA synthetase
MSWLRLHRGAATVSHDELWLWSVTDLAGFWSAVWEYFGVTSHAPYTRVLAERVMPGTTWFPGARINYADYALGDGEDGGSRYSHGRRPGRISNWPSASSATRWPGLGPY